MFRSKYVMQSAINHGIISIRRMKPKYSLPASLFISEMSRSNAKFGEDKATTANCITPQPPEELSKVFSRFLADFRTSELFAYGRLSLSFPFFLFSFSFRTTDEPLTLFSRQDICAIIFSGRRSLFRSLSLFLSMREYRAHTPLVQSKTRTHAL